MTTGRAARACRILARSLAVLLLIAAISGPVACRHAGRFLVVEDPLQPADVIVVLAGRDVERWLEAVDLYREGYARLVVLSPGYDDPLGDRLRAGGIRFPRRVHAHQEAMVQLGVPESAVEILAGGYDNTADEAQALQQLSARRGWNRLIVVTSDYHTRRTRFAFQRAFEKSPAEVLVRGTRHDDASPGEWWRKRSDKRWVILELQKLLAYRLGLDK